METLELIPAETTARKSIYEYFQQAMRRPKDAASGTAGELQAGAEGNSAVFYLTAAGGRITKAEFRCTTCVTLVALCEHLAELAVGSSPDEARELNAGLMLQLHPEVPAPLQDRAGLACAALHAAITALEKGNES